MKNTSLNCVFISACNTINLYIYIYFLFIIILLLTWSKFKQFPEFIFKTAKHSWRHNARFRKTSQLMTPSTPDFANRVLWLADSKYRKLCLLNKSIRVIDNKKHKFACSSVTFLCCSFYWRSLYKSCANGRCFDIKIGQNTNFWEADEIVVAFNYGVVLFKTIKWMRKVTFE